MVASTLDVFVHTAEIIKYDEVSGSYSGALKRDWLTSRYRQRVAPEPRHEDQPEVSPSRSS
jgi:hypothetical protein